MRRREMLEFAVLGLLHEDPLHGYELRRRLNARLGAFRALSFGTLYPCLASLQDQGLVAVQDDVAPAASSTRRQRITYTITDVGREAFALIAGRTDPGSWEDDAFDVRVAFFARTEREVRLRILEGRRARLAEQLAGMRTGEGPIRLDRWSAALAAHGEDAAERAVSWLDELIDAERRGPQARPGTLSDPSPPAFNPPPTKENP